MDSQILKQDTYLSFEITCQTKIGEVLFIVGNIPELGDWDFNKGIKLETNESIYPLWKTKEKIKVPLSKIILFKFVKIYENSEKYEDAQWEELSKNRQIYTRYHDVSYKVQWNIDQMIPITNKRYIDSMLSQDKIIDQLKITHYKNNGDSFDPYKDSNHRDTDSDYSEKSLESESIIEETDQDYQQSNKNKLTKTPPQKNIQQQNNRVNNFNNPTENKDILQNNIKSNENINNGVIKSNNGKHSIQQYQNNQHQIQQGQKQQSEQDISLIDIYKQQENHSHKREKIRKKSFTESVNQIIDLQNDRNYNLVYQMNQQVSDNIIFCNFFLPLKIFYQESNDQWKIQFDDDTLLYHYYQAFPSSAFVGIVSNYDEIEREKFNQIEQDLIAMYNCYPIFIEKEKLDKFLFEFCYPVLDPLMNNEIDLTNISENNCTPELWELFSEICQIFTQRVQDLVHQLQLNLQKTYFFILDHRILLTTSFLSELTIKPCILYFSYGKFPHYQTVKIFPYYQELINAIMNADFINFTEYEQSLNFFPTIKQMFGITVESRHATLQFKFQGRIIIMNFKHPGVNVNAITTAMQKQQYQNLDTQIQEKYKDDMLIIGVDHLSLSSNLILKFKLIQKYLEDNPNQKNIKFIQIIITRKHTLKDEKKLKIKNELKQLEQQLTKKFPEQVEVKFDYFPLYHRLAYFKNANILLKTSNYSLTDIFIYEFMLVNMNDVGACMFFDLNNQNKLYHSLFKFNPLSYNDFKRVLEETREGDQNYYNNLRNLDKNTILQQNNSLYWIQNCLNEFKNSEDRMINLKLTGTGHGTQFMKVAHKLKFKQLSNYSVLIDQYMKTKNRLFVFGYEGALVEDQKYNFIKVENNIVKKFKSKPDENLLKSLKILCEDERNTVYIITELPKEFLDIWFKDIPNLGLASEGGFAFKVNKPKGNSEWQNLTEFDMNWKNLVNKIMDEFVLRTQGSKILKKEKSLIWSYQGVDVVFAQRQEEQLLTQLRLIQKKFPDIVISSSRSMVEVSVTNINKEVFTNLLIKQKRLQSGQQIDFVCSIGKGISCEDMFKSIKQNDTQTNNFEQNINPFTICIGVKPSHADYYVKDYESVKDLILCICEYHEELQQTESQQQQLRQPNNK